MNTEGSNQDTGLTTQEAAASIRDILYPGDSQDTQEKRDGNAAKATANAAEEAEAEETEGGEEETKSDEVEATESDDVESDDEGQDEADDQDQDDPRHTVKVDGKEVEVPLSELKAGYSRQSDYTRKTQALAKEREEFQPHVEAVRQERAQYAHLLGILEQQVKAGTPESFDMKRFDEDPIEAPKEYALWQANQARLAAIKSEQDRIEAAQQAEREEQMKVWLQGERALLMDKVPTWRDPEKAKTEYAAIREHAVKALGFDDKDMDQALDHRLLVTLRKAWQFDQLMAKSKTTKPVVPKAKTATPGNAQPPRKGTDLTRSKQRLAKTGSVKDAAGVIRQILG